MGSRLAILLFSVVLTGCTRDLTFRVVDAATGEPVADVKNTVDISIWQPGAPGLFLVNLRTIREDCIAETDSEGLVQQADVSSNQRIYFEKEGYCSAIIDRRWPTVRIRQFEQGDTVTVSGKEVNGVIVVPLNRGETRSWLSPILPIDESTTDEPTEIN